MYELVIFDLDGTILDTLEDLADSTNYALRMHGFPERTIEEIRSFVGNGIGKLIKRAVPEGTDVTVVEKVLADFKVYYAAHCADKTKPYHGIPELIQKLKHQGYRTAVVSNKADFAVQQLCEDYFFGLFDFVVGEREGIRRKPAPDSVLEVLEQLHVEKEKALYVGDSEVDIQTADHAGVDQVSVEWGFRNREYLLSQGAKKMVRMPEEILSVLEAARSQKVHRNC
ncbi:MAG: HAD family hydrolase [Clostridium sp.]|nr:HAD family hydrolase [Clostridium sp.]